MPEDIPVDINEGRMSLGSAPDVKPKFSITIHYQSLWYGASHSGLPQTVVQIGSWTNHVKVEILNSLGDHNYKPLSAIRHGSRVLLLIHFRSIKLRRCFLFGFSL